METIRGQLEFQRWRRPTWMEYHFPAVAQRGTEVTYEDVEGMTDAQADSVRHLLASQILHHRQVIRRRQARTIGFLGDDEAADDEWAIRARQLEEALYDLCSALGLSEPL